jgi:hypothetical protein
MTGAIIKLRNRRVGVARHLGTTVIRFRKLEGRAVKDTTVELTDEAAEALLMALIEIRGGGVLGEDHWKLQVFTDE